MNPLRLSARRGLFGDRDFRMLWTGETISALGTSVTRLAIPLAAVVTLHAGTLQVSLLTAASWLPWLLISLPAGAWVDRLSRRRVMVTCDVLSLVLLLSVPIAAWTDHLSYAHLAAVALLVGAAGVFFQTAYAVYLPGILDDEHLTEANAKLLGSEAATQVAGPGLAGLFAQAAGATTALVVDASSYAVSVLCLLRIRRRERVEPSRADRLDLGRQVGDGLRFLVTDPYLRVLTVYGALSNLVLTGYQAILVVFLIRTVGVSPAAVGGLLSGMSVGGLIGAMMASLLSRRLGDARAMLVANLAVGPFALLIPLTSRGFALSLFVVGGLGVGAGVVAGNVLKSSFRQTYTPRPLLGRVLASMQLLNYGTIPVGALLGGVAGSALGLRTAMWIMVCGAALAPWALLVGPLKRHREFPKAPAAVL